MNILRRSCIVLAIVLVLAVMTFCVVGVARAATGVPVAQTDVLPPLNVTTLLAAYGPLGLIAMGLAWLHVKELRTMSASQAAGQAEVVTELRVLGHRWNGVTKQRWAEMLERDQYQPEMLKMSEKMKEMIHEELRLLDTEPEVAALRAKGSRNPQGK